MKFSAKTISFLALDSAAGVVILLLLSVLPTARLALFCLSGVFPALALVYKKLPGALSVYGITALLALLLLPSKSAALLYLIFFGLYPVLKAYAEKYISRAWFCWLCKGLFFCLITVLVILFFRLFLPSVCLDLSVFLLFPLCVVALFVYDVCFSLLMRLVLSGISRYIHDD